MQLIVNADDYAYCPGVCQGILQAATRGIVRSTTVMANMDGFEEAVAKAKEVPGLGIGVHLNLTSGKPLTASYPYVDENGCFLRDFCWAPNHERQVVAELTAQLERVLSTGVHPTHLDSHHHIHDKDYVSYIVLDFSRSYGLPVRPYGRWARADIFLSTGFFGNPTQELLLQQLTLGLQSGKPVMELMCHPGIADESLLSRSSYTYGRERELALLCSQETFHFLAEHKISLINYRGVPVADSAPWRS